MGGRTRSRLKLFPRAIVNRWLKPRLQPQQPARILVAHNLLLGDTLMLAPLFAKLRQKYPQAQITTLVKPAFLGLFKAQPYGVRALGFDPRKPETVEALLSNGGYDLALVPGDNRYAWLAAALGSKWIRAFAEDHPGLKSAPVDEVIAYPAAPAAWSDMNGLLVVGAAPKPYRVGDWPAPPGDAFDTPKQPYAVLHTGASTPLKHWPAEHWRQLSRWLVEQGIQPVWSTGPGEGSMLTELVEVGQSQYPGNLKLEQLWHLVANARLLVCPDTGVSHLGKLTGTPTVTLFGPGAADIHGAGDYWRDMPYRAVTVSPFPCRNQHVLFGRQISWVQRCGRSTKECAEPRCMQAISYEAVKTVIESLL